jgi:outer membrane protein assembly factor BamA
MIRTQMEVADGDFLDLAKIAKSRRNLYTTGAYSMVEITREELGAEGTDEQTRTRTAEGDGGEKPVRLIVNVREIQPWQLRYGGLFDTERGPGGIVDFSNRNSLHSARVLGFRGRYDKQLQEARVYFSQPMLRRFPLKTIASPYARFERNPATTEADPFNVDRLGFSLQQESNFRQYWLLNYGYRIERSHTYDPTDTEGLFDVRLRVAGLTSSLTRDSRDEILDATRGSFFSQAMQWSPEVLGSQVRFIKYFGQYFRYIPLQAPRIELFTNKVERPRLVYAGAARVGLAKGFGGQEVPLAERFFAGGSTTIRGFEQNSVGPKILDRDPTGGQAMLVINNEIRFPVVSIFDGVGFVDIGNVYRRVSDFSFGDIRKAAGLGVRVRTPWFLLRLDYGFKLDRREGESRGRLFFSIGQAF